LIIVWVFVNDNSNFIYKRFKDYGSVFFSSPYKIPVLCYDIGFYGGVKWLCSNDILSWDHFFANVLGNWGVSLSEDAFFDGL